MLTQHCLYFTFSSWILSLPSMLLLDIHGMYFYHKYTFLSLRHLFPGKYLLKFLNKKNLSPTFKAIINTTPPLARTVPHSSIMCRNFEVVNALCYGIRKDQQVRNLKISYQHNAK